MASDPNDIIIGPFEDADSTEPGTEFRRSGPREIGVDIALDWVSGELSLTPGNGMLTISDIATVRQWVRAALTQPQGTSMIYPATFGSRLYELLGTGAGSDQVAAALEQTLLQHDRIVGVSDVLLDPASTDVEGFGLSFRVLLDTGQEIIFPEV